MSEEENNKEFTTPYRGTEEKDVEETGVKQGEESQIRQEEPPSQA